MGRIFLAFVFAGWASGALAQAQAPVQPERAKTFVRYLAARHGGPEGLEGFRASNPKQYQLELWYFCESFYVKRNVRPAGQVFNEAAFDITRFEGWRKWDSDTTIVLPGYKDDLVLLAGKTLLHKPSYVR